MILIVGDSFAENFNQSTESWTFLLSQQVSTVNLAQAGCGQYKILKQLKSVDLNNFDKIIISHTSHTRLHVENNPYYNTGKHAHADLIYEDILHKPQSKMKEHLLFFFKRLVDLEYQKFVYECVCREISELCKNKDCIHLNFFPQNQVLYIHFTKVLEMHNIWKNYPGTVNHLNLEGNCAVYEKICELI